MTVLALGEHIARCLSERCDQVKAQKSNMRVVLVGRVGAQTFVVTVEEQAKDAQQPAVT